MKHKIFFNSNRSKYYEAFSQKDKRYYGLFSLGKEGRIKVDPKRYHETIGLSKCMINTMLHHRKGLYFRPSKKDFPNYNINFIKAVLNDIKEEWNNDTKPMIANVLSEIKGKYFLPMEDEFARSAILDYDEACINATIKSWLSHAQAEKKRNRLYYSLYAQLYHQMASIIEALTLKLLTRNGYEEERFCRKKFCNFKQKKNIIKKLDSYSEYDKLYVVWNFIKHNSLSAYKQIQEYYPFVLYQEEKYEQGNLACYYVNFSNELIESILCGVEQFLKDYCQVIFDENEFEASWNYDAYFISGVDDAINQYVNPMGLPSWI